LVRVPAFPVLNQQAGVAPDRRFTLVLAADVAVGDGAGFDQAARTIEQVLQLADPHVALADLELAGGVRNRALKFIYSGANVDIS